MGNSLPRVTRKRKLPYPFPTSPAISAAMRGNRKTGTRPEIQMHQALQRRGHRFCVGKVLSVGGLVVRPDIVFSADRIAVFVDGCFWHSCPSHRTVPKVNRNYWLPKLFRVRRRDRLVTTILKSEGWTVIRVWEHSAMANAVRRVESSLKRSRERGR